jgi:hypothetical protein
MEDLSQRYTHLVCSRSKRGDSLAQISELLSYSADQVVEILAKAVNLTPNEVKVILRLKHRGLPNIQIGQEFLVDVEVLDKFLSDSVVYPSIGEGPTVQVKAKIKAPKVDIKVPKIHVKAPLFGAKGSSSSSSSSDNEGVTFGAPKLVVAFPKVKSDIKAQKVSVSQPRVRSSSSSSG